MGEGGVVSGLPKTWPLPQSQRSWLELSETVEEFSTETYVFFGLRWPPCVVLEGGLLSEHSDQVGLVGGTHFLPCALDA